MNSGAAPNKGDADVATSERGLFIVRKENKWKTQNIFLSHSEEADAPF